MNRGSWNADDSDRPRWGAKTVLVAEYDYHHEDGTYAYTVMKGINPDKEKIFTIRRRNMMRDMLEPEDKVEWFLGMGEEKPVLFRLPDLIAATKSNPGCRVLIPEGEKDVMTAVGLGYVATCNWRSRTATPVASFLSGPRRSTAASTRMEIRSPPA
jgi:hypothetical protein